MIRSFPALLWLSLLAAPALGQSWDQVSVPASGVVVSSNKPLEIGTWYEIQVSGTVTIPHPADGEYYAAGTSWNDPIRDGNSGSQGEDHGLEVDACKYFMGPYNDAHIYVITIPGTGDLLDLRYLDSDYSGNSGNLTVDINPAPPSETVTVPSDGSSVSTSIVLQEGWTYAIMAKGVISIGGILSADAEYYWDGSTVYDGNSVLDHGIAVNGTKVRWGTYQDASHTYVIRLVGNGQVASFRYLDDPYSDNSGDLSVEIVAQCQNEYGEGSPGTGGATPSLSMAGCFGPPDQEYVYGDNQVTIAITDGLGDSSAFLMFGMKKLSLEVGGCWSLLVNPLLLIPVPLGSDGSFQASFTIQPNLLTSLSIPNFPVRLQAFIMDPGAYCGRGFSTTNGLCFNIQ